MANLIAGMIFLAISAIVLVNVFISTVKTANTSTWSAAEVALWGTVSLVAIAGFLFGIVQVFGLNA